MLTLAVDQAIMIITVDKLGWNGLLMKIISNIIVIILNFIFSKILIFKKETKSENNVKMSSETIKFIVFASILLIINLLLVTVSVQDDTYTLNLPTTTLFGSVTWGVTLILGIYGILAIKFGINKKIKLENIYLMLVIPIGIAFCFANPLGRIPDEDQHVRKAMAIAQGNFFSTKVMNGGAVDTFNKKLGELVSGSAYDYRDAWRRINIEETDETAIAGYTNQALYSPVCHMPQAFGIFVTKLVGANLVVQCYAARLFNLAFSIFLIYEAIKLLPFKKHILLCIAMLPITMNELASMSADALTISSSLFLIAYVLYLKYDNTKLRVSKKDIIILALTSITVAMCKIVYLPLCLMLFMIPKEKFGTANKKNIITITIIAISTLLNLIWLAYASRFLVEFIEGVNSKEQLKYILTNPISFFLIMFRTMAFHSQRFILGLCGEGLSMVTANTSQLYVVSSMMFLFTLFICNDEDEIEIKWYTKIFAFIIFVGIVVLIYTSLYIQWTPLIASLIDGVQARYFIPILFLTTISMYNRAFKFSSKKYIGYILLFILFFNLNGITSIIYSHF